MIFNQSACRAGRERSFDLYKKWNAGKTLKDLVERRDAMSDRGHRIQRSSAEAKSRVERYQFGESHPLDRAGSVGRAIDRRVVNHHDFAVRGEPHVEFQPIGAIGDGEPHRLDGILRRARSSSAVRDHRSSVELEESVQANTIRCTKAAPRT